MGIKLQGIPDLLWRAWQTPWLGPGLVLAFLLLVTLRSARRVATKPLHRSFRAPRLERFRGEIPRRHEDLEI